MKKLPIGISDFRKVISGNNYFVDKSLFIKELVNSNAEVSLIPRPRRFGKTLKSLYASNTFLRWKRITLIYPADLQIYKTDESTTHLGTYPVISL